jgi:hypothetical protein
VWPSEALDLIVDKSDIASYLASHSSCFAVVGIEYPLVNVIANVPLVVIGLPLTLSPVGTVSPTEVTVPVLDVLLAAKSYAALTAVREAEVVELVVVTESLIGLHVFGLEGNFAVISMPLTLAIATIVFQSNVSL